MIARAGFMSYKGESMIAPQNTNSKKNIQPAKRPRLGVYIVSLAVVAVVGIGLYLAIGRSHEEDATAKAKPTNNKITEVTPVQSKQATGESPVTNTAPVKPEPPPFVKRPGAMQLPNGKVLTFPAPKGDEIRKVYAYGHMYECDSEGNFRDVTKRQLFHSAFEANFLGLAIEDKPFIPAFLTGLDQEEVKQILTKNYEPIGDETEEEMAQLKAYDDMRCAALQFMEEGGTFDEFVDYFAKQVKDERETNALCLREVMTLVKEGKLEEARDMAEAANRLKEQKGLKPLKLPAHVQAAFDEMN